jgi:uncharacterized protein YndB with AHSA1/START domain
VSRWWKRYFPRFQESIESVSRCAAAISEKSIALRTGKSWAQWFRILDSAGAKDLDHKQIVSVLKSRYRLSPWWQQMVSVEYERERGLREKHQTTSGFRAQVSRTIGAPLEHAFDARQDGTLRRSWLDASGLVIRSSTPGKSLYIAWNNGSTNVEVRFTSKSSDKSSVTVEHSRLANAQESERLREFWASALGRLKDLLEKPSR